MAVRCYDCGSEGHYGSECPNREALDTRPSWCGICDQRTRHRTVNLELGTVEKCPDCHPSPNKPLTQHRRCPHCKVVTYQWDNAECGKHLVPGRKRPGIKALSS